MTAMEEGMIDHIKKCQQRGFTPSQRELGIRFQRSPSIVNRHLKKLEKQGLIRIRGARYIELL